MTRTPHEHIAAAERLLDAAQGTLSDRRSLSQPTTAEQARLQIAAAEAHIHLADVVHGINTWSTPLLPEPTE